MRSICALLAAPLLLAGCSSSYVAVPDAAGVAAIDASRMSCSRPYILAQDCSNTSGALGRFAIDGIKMKAAANAVGDRVVLFADSSQRSAEKKSNNGYAALKAKLLENDYEIVNVMPIQRNNQLIGYAVKTNKPVYEFMLALR
jgi:hypothetical protein